MRHRRLALLLVACAATAALLTVQRHTPRTAIGDNRQPPVHSELNPPRFRLTPEMLETLRQMHDAPPSSQPPSIPATHIE